MFHGLAAIPLQTGMFGAELCGCRARASSLLHLLPPALPSCQGSLQLLLLGSQEPLSSAHPGIPELESQLRFVLEGADAPH